MDEENLYDEFGNYIGPELAENEEAEEDQQDFYHEELSRKSMDEEKDADKQGKPVKEHRIVLHEDKKYYPEMDEVYPEAEALIMEEDAQPITQPIISTIKSKNFDVVEPSIPETSFSFEFLCGMMGKPELIRNVALVGHLHHGKTSLMDLFVQQTHYKDWKLDKQYKYTDTRKDEQQRMISIKSTPMSLVLPDSREKSYIINLYDTPGHPNFSDEACCALRACDGALLIVDAIEGVMINTERMIRYMVQENIAINVVINKIDRLVLELKMPPADAYLKIKHTLEEINSIIASASYLKEIKEDLRVSPLLGNVAFASSSFGFIFTIQSFAKIYSEMHGVNKETFSKILWGDIYYDSKKKKFSKTPSKEFNKRTFVEFLLEPMYKIMAHTVSNEMEDLAPMLGKLGIYLKKDEYRMDSRPLLRLVCQKFFGDTSSAVDLMVKHVPNAKDATSIKLEMVYSGNKKSNVYQRIKKCDPQENLVVNIVKLYHKPDCLSFDAFGRVISGTIHKNEMVKVLGENYSLEDEEDMAVKSIKNLWIYEGTYRVEVNKVSAGNWVLIEGIDQSISKTATLISAKETEPIEIFRPIRFNTNSVVKMACEPLIPSELPKMLEGIRKINKSYPLLTTKVEESGEHILIGTGELYMDCALHDLREIYSEIEIKVSDLSVSFCETVIDTSSIKCYGETPNKKNKLTILSSPLDKGLADEIESERIKLGIGQKKVSEFFQTKYDWDILASRSVWAFGPTKQGPNLFLDDTLSSEIDKALLGTVKDSIVQGFQWSTREGPLCDEPIRNVKFKLIEASIAQENLYRAGGQIIPTARRVCYSSFLMATPRMMEPMYLAEIQCSADCLNAIYTLIGKRRGHPISELAKPGSPLYTVKAHIPVIDSFGFETDLRVLTSGQAFSLMLFDHWSLLPGDPLDKTIILKPLEPSPAPHLAREFMIKTRRRKGLNEDVSIMKYFDDPKLLEALKLDEDYKAYI